MFLKRFFAFSGFFTFFKIFHVFKFYRFQDSSSFSKFIDIFKNYRNKRKIKVMILIVHRTIWILSVSSSLLRKNAPGRVVLYLPVQEFIYSATYKAVVALNVSSVSVKQFDSIIALFTTKHVQYRCLIQYAPTRKHQSHTSNKGSGGSGKCNNRIKETTLWFGTNFIWAQRKWQPIVGWNPACHVYV